MRRQAEGRGGFVLVAVLGVLALLAGMVGALSLAAGNGVSGAGIAAERLRSDALLTAGLEMAGYQLFAAGLAIADVNTQEIRLEAGTVTLLVSGEGGKVDINGSGADLLAAAYRASGAAAMAPEVFAARVVDWRDPDSERGDGGAEAPDYAAAGVPFAPRNNPFRTIDELGWVLNLSPAERAALSELVTVNNPAGAIDVLSAPPALLAALPGMSEARLEAVLGLRGGGEASRDALEALLAEQASAVTYGNNAAVVVRIEARPLAAGPVRRVRATLIQAVAGDRPYQVVDWRETTAR